MPSFTNQSRPRPGFTLLELIISVAIVLLLMLAVTKIFSITSTTVGTSQGLAAATRDARGAQTVLSRDIGAMASDAPFIVISSHTIPAFRNPTDAKGDKDYDPSLTDNTTPKRYDVIRSIDLTDDGVETPYSALQPAIANVRSFRSDVFTFFARQQFLRQTNDTRVANGPLISPGSSTEAWVWYGHLSLANNQAGYPRPAPDYIAVTDAGAGDSQVNPNNFYANQFTLGRVVTLLQSNPIPDPGTTQPPRYLEKISPFPTAAPAINFAPFDARVDKTDEKLSNLGSIMTKADDKTPERSHALVTARYDLANINFADATKLLNLQPADWPERLPGMTDPADGSRMPFRANSFINKPINVETVSEQAPIFVTGCSSFVVEFAGDFITQNSVTGAVIPKNPLPTTDPEPDGILDFTVDAASGARQTRWYGFPRDTNGDGIIRGADGDVVPVADVRNRRMSFERWLPYEIRPTITTTFADVRGSYSSPNGDSGHKDRYGNSDAIPSLGVSIDQNPQLVNYQVAWGPDSIRNPSNPRPTMYRMVLTIDRPEMEGRTATGQSFEYVFNVP